jgi:hypothetical protein
LPALGKSKVGPARAGESTTHLTRYYCTCLVAHAPSHSHLHLWARRVCFSLSFNSLPHTFFLLHTKLCQTQRPDLFFSSIYSYHSFLHFFFNILNDFSVLNISRQTVYYTLQASFAPAEMALLLSSEGTFEVGTTDDSSSNVASATSTPPTTVADEASLHSDSPKRDVVHVALDPGSPEVAPTTSEPIEPTETDSAANAPPPTPIRSRRSRVSAPVYNLVQLSGTAGHGKRRAKGDIVADRRRRRKTISGPILGDDMEKSSRTQGATPETVRSGIDALGATQSASKLDSPRARRQKIAEESSSSRRSSTRRASVFAPIAATPITKNSKVTKRSRKSMEKPSTPMSRELRRLQDTKEFAHIDEKPVVLSVWSNGKFVDPKAARSASRKKAEPEQAAEEPKEAEAEPVINTRKRRVKKYLAKGLYAGQDAPIDISKGLSVGEKKALAQLPELIPSGRVNKTMPLPMFNGLRTLIEGRDFKLPYQVCNPLPPGQPKPDEWKKMTKSKFCAEIVRLALTLSRSLHWRIQGLLAKVPPLSRLFIEVRLQARRWLWRELPKPNYALRM